MTDESITVYGPKASVQMTLRVDTGARNTIVPESVATRLGLDGPYTAVSTYGRNVTWKVAEGYVSVHGTKPVKVPIWISPDGDTPALGETAMSAMGYRIVRPASTGQTMNLRSPAAGAAQAAPSPAASFADFDYASRRAICDSCPYETVSLGIARCSACGCPLQSKLRLSAPGSCPMGRW